MEQWEEILAMKPGRELDKLVAEKVYNYELKYFGGCSPHFTKNYGKMLPHYSTNIAAAWGIVEKLSKNIGCFYMWQHIDYVTVSCGVLINAKTMPEAICKAALIHALSKEQE